MRRSLSVFVVSLVLMPVQAHCWWEEGHQAIARIAARHLSAAARQRVAQILEVENTPEAVAEAMATASIWADQMKAESGTGNWHFIDLTLQDSRANIAERCVDDNCITARIRLFATQLKAADADADTAWSDEDALRFLIHFVGDVHQPLHAISDADEGGNCELLDSPIDEAKNLHALWDGPLVAALGSDDTRLAAELDTEIAAMTDGERDDFASGDADDWAWESHRLAIVNVYRRLEVPKQDIEFPETCADAPEGIREFHGQIDEAYIAAMEPVVRDQLKKAGLRLAKMLNEAL
jgi:hypothetical protein